MKNKKGYVLIAALSFIAVLVISAASIFFMVGTEALRTRRQLETTKAFYAAEGGAERMFEFISANPDTATFQTITENQAQWDFDAGTQGLYDYPVGHPHHGDSTRMLIEVLSTGTSGSTSKDVTVEYEVQNVAWGNASLLTLGNDINLQGHTKTIKILWFTIEITAGIDLEGPVASSGAVIKNEPTDAISITGQEVEGVGVPTPEFMQAFDANRDSDELVDPNSDGQIEYAEIPLDPVTGLPDPVAEAIFLADDVNNDNVVNERDGFIYYYTKELNYNGGGDLGMDPDAASHPYYYSGDQTFGPGGIFESVPADTDIVFIDGNVDIVLNPASWGGGARDITLVSTGDITIVEPCNGDDDRLTLVSYQDVATGGINLQFIDLIDSNMNVYAHDDFYASYGGDTEGTVIAKDYMDIDTEDASLLFAREIGNSDDIVQDPPVGLPPMAAGDFGDLFVQNVCQIPLNFDITNKPYSWSTKD
ncbi:MAG: hypothetical protein ABH875_00635 [Candidatus Omnitrophota bacterium]